jgi:hypothetical protein
LRLKEKVIEIEKGGSGRDIFERETEREKKEERSERSVAEESSIEKKKKKGSRDSRMRRDGERGGGKTSSRKGD